MNITMMVEMQILSALDSRLRGNDGQNRVLFHTRKINTTAKHKLNIES
jgi:hypothetical protein